MEDRFEDFLSNCSHIDFGKINFSDRKRSFYRKINREIILLCKSLPKSTQIDTFIFLLQYAGLSFGDEFDFFRNYYAPSWSILYWLLQSSSGERNLCKEDTRKAITAHSMAMILHPLDDHLNDNELPVNHLVLLLRAQIWMVMNTAFNGLAQGIIKGGETVKDLINDYYTGIRSYEKINTLDQYCDLFRKQMATWLVTPVLLSKKKTNDECFVSDIQTAYGSFGIAWRLLDDINDINTDLMKSVHSSIYYSLPDRIKSLWDKQRGELSIKENTFQKITLEYILENKIVEHIKERISIELELAASIADHYNLRGLSDEFRCLKKPIRNNTEPI